MRSLSSLFACIIVAGCSSMRAQQVANSLDPLIGRPIAEIEDHFGPPSSQYASSDTEETFEWNNFGAGQSGMSGCRVLVVALRTSKPMAGDAPLNADTLTAAPDYSTTWMVKSWSSYGSGCR